MEATTETNQSGVVEGTEIVTDANTPEVITEQIEKPVEQQQQVEPVVEKELSEEDFLKQYNKRFGKEAKSFDEIAPAKPEPSEEEKKKEITTKERKVLDKFLKFGGTIEQYGVLKGIANADIKEFSIADTQKEMADAGFSKDEIDATLKERYYLLTEEEKAELSDEDAALIKKNEFFSKKLEGKSAYKIEQARKVLNDLQSQVDADDLLTKTDAIISSTVDEYAQKMPRTITLDMGESNGTKLNPVIFEVQDADLASVMETLKDPTKRNDFLYNQDGTENVKNLMDAMVLKQILPNIVKKAALQATTEQVEFLEAKFPKSPQAVAPGFTPSRNGGAAVGKAIEGTEKTTKRASAPLIQK